MADDDPLVVTLVWYSYVDPLTGVSLVFYFCTLFVVE